MAINLTAINISHLINPITAIAVIPIIVVSVALILMLRGVMPISQFLYANARVSARTNYMAKNLNGLAEAKSLKEFKGMLYETSYSELLEKAPENVKAFHLALEKSFIESIMELREFSPKKMQPLISAYLMFYEAKILKAIYRARLIKVKLNEDIIYSIGNIDDGLLKHLNETQTVNDIAVVMAPTVYKEIMEKDYLKLEEFEVAIDQFVLDFFLKTQEKFNAHDKKCITEVISAKIDIINTIALLKFRIRNVDKKVLINNNSVLYHKMSQLMNANSLKELVDMFKGTPYEEAMLKAFNTNEETGSLYAFEKELYSYFKKFVADKDLAHTLGPYPLFSYILKKEIELRNLYIISKGIDEGFEIKEMII